MVAQKIEVAADPNGAPEGDQPRVLVTDLDADFRRRVAGLARALGRQCRELSDATAILDELHRRPGPAVLVLNVRQLESGGERVVRSLSGHPEHAVVLVADPGTPQVLVATQLGIARQLNVTDVVEKPVEDEELREILRRRGRMAPG